jgi:hypothetical protein
MELAATSTINPLPPPAERRPGCLLVLSAPGAQITHRLLESTVQVHDLGLTSPPTTEARSTPPTFSPRPSLPPASSEDLR